MRVLSQGQEDPLDKEMALQYFCLGNPMDRGAWRATVYEVARVEHDLKTEQQQFYLLHNRKEHNIVCLVNECVSLSIYLKLLTWGRHLQDPKLKLMT